MLETYGIEELGGLAGHEVVDANGESVGFVDLVFVDDATGRPEWLGIWSGVAGKGPRVLVPTASASAAARACVVWSMSRPSSRAATAAAPQPAPR